jgi:acetyl esterase/lipase
MDLDDAYANAAHIPRAETYPPAWAAAAAGLREALTAQGRADLDLSYGPTTRQAVDLFHPEGPAKGLCIFVHGGYWLRFDKSWWSHLAAGPLARGWAVAIPSYDLCPDLRIAGITGQIARAVAAMARRVEGPLALTGHSAGGHLVARMCVPGILPGAVAARLARVVPISPVADLRPLLRTGMNDSLRLDAAAAAAESPVLMTPMPGVQVRVWVGGEERPAFLDQARWLAGAWDCPLRIAEGRHHFDVIDSLADPATAMMADLVG